MIQNSELEAEVDMSQVEKYEEMADKYKQSENDLDHANAYITQLEVDKNNLSNEKNELRKKYNAKLADIKKLNKQIDSISLCMCISYGMGLIIVLGEVLGVF